MSSFGRAESPGKSTPSRRQRPSLLRIFGEGYAYSQNSFATTVLNGCRINHVAITRFFVDDIFPRLVDFTGFDQLDFGVDLVCGTVFNDFLCLGNTSDK